MSKIPRPSKDALSRTRRLWPTISAAGSKFNALRTQGPFSVIKRKLRKKKGPQTNETKTEQPADEEQQESSLVRDRPELSIGAFEIGHPLGRGQFGQVYLAKHKTSGYICALKIMNKAQVGTGGGENLIRRELEVHQNLAHPNILKFHAWFHDEKQVYLILEYAPGGNLYKEMHKQPRGRFREDIAARYITQIAQALDYMHKKNVMHRDLKPENILIGLHNEIKLADFGYSVHTVSGFRSTVCGTLDYLPPEIAIRLHKPGHEHEFYTKAIDQWSLGVLAYEFVVGKPPFVMKSDEATQKKIAEFKGTVKFPGHVSRPAEEFVRQLLNIDAHKRMSLQDVLEHPWIVAHIGKPSQDQLSGLI